VAEWYTPWHKRLKVGEELMADDIVQRLRGYADRSHLAIPSNLTAEAADEIESLRHCAFAAGIAAGNLKEDNHRLRQALQQVAYSTYTTGTGNTEYHRRWVDAWDTVTASARVALEKKQSTLGRGEQ